MRGGQGTDGGPPGPARAGLGSKGMRGAGRARRARSSGWCRLEARRRRGGAAADLHAAAACVAGPAGGSVRDSAAASRRARARASVNKGPRLQIDGCSAGKGAGRRHASARGLWRGCVPGRARAALTRRSSRCGRAESQEQERRHREARGACAAAGAGHPAGAHGCRGSQATYLDPSDRQTAALGGRSNGCVG